MIFLPSFSRIPTAIRTLSASYTLLLTLVYYVAVSSQFRKSSSLSSFTATSLQVVDFIWRTTLQARADSPRNPFSLGRDFFTSISFSLTDLVPVECSSSFILISFYGVQTFSSYSSSLSASLPSLKMTRSIYWLTEFSGSSLSFSGEQSRCSWQWVKGDRWLRAKSPGVSMSLSCCYSSGSYSFLLSCCAKLKGVGNGDQNQLYFFMNKN